MISESVNLHIVYRTAHKRSKKKDKKKNPQKKVKKQNKRGKEKKDKSQLMGRIKTRAVSIKNAIHLIS